ncbi:HepT-like ribonuclease domain-containing protein [Rhizobium binxianense]
MVVERQGEPGYLWSFGHSQDFGAGRRSSGFSCCLGVAQWSCKQIRSSAKSGMPLRPHAISVRPEIPWPRVKAIGNVPRHEYHGLSDRIICGIIVAELPKIRIVVEAIQRHVDQAD